MAARRCSNCSRSWPVGVLVCPDCETSTWWDEDACADELDDETVDASVPVEQSDLWSYRVRRFRVLGFNRPQRVRLANDGADWHQARDLLGRGCPVELVFDLLSG